MQAPLDRSRHKLFASGGRALLAASAALIATIPTAGSAAESFLSPAGPIAKEIGFQFYFIVGVMILVILPIFISLPFILYRFRLKDDGDGTARGSYKRNWDHNTLLEVLVWGGAGLAIIAMGTMVWISTHQLDPYKPLDDDPFDVELVTYDWGFMFIYPEENVATVNELIIPTNEPVRIKLTSDSVMQSVFIPKLAGQIYAMAGMQTMLNFVSHEDGTFEGRNTQYNGEGFADQTFEVQSLNADDFAAKMADLQTAPDELTHESFDAVVAGSGVTSFGSVEDGFFVDLMASFGGHDMMGHVMKLDEEADQADHAAGTHASTDPADESTETSDMNQKQEVEGQE